MMKDLVKKFATAYAVILGIVVLGACTSELQNSPSNGPAATAKVLSIKVAANTAVVQQWTQSPAVPERGGWFEKADAPTLAETVDYAAIDPKNLIQVTKILDAEQGEVVCTPDEFTVVVLTDTTTNAAAPDTKLQIGYAYLKVFLKENKDVIATYYDVEGGRTINPYLTMLVASATAPSTAFAGFTILKHPVKMVYDWEEPFDAYGLQVIKWYGGLSFDDGGVPVIADAADYIVDASAYTNITQRTAGVPALPLDSYDPIPIYVRQSASETAGAADFKINLVLQQHQVSFKSPDGGEITGGFVAFHGGGSSSYKVRDLVKINFNRGTSYNLNGDSVRIRYDELSVAPGFSGIGATNQLNFVWLVGSFTTEDGVSTVKEDQNTVTASFEMPAADVTVVVEYVYASTRLSNIEVKPASSEAWTSIYGFSPNISIYDYVLPLADSSLSIRASTSADDINFDFEPQVGFSSGAAGTVTINSIGVDGVIVSIVASNGGESARTYIVRVKRFNSNKVTYNFTGNVQTFHPPVAGQYLFTAWGGDGGDSPSFLADMARYNWNKNGATGKGGRGGKVSGKLYMDPNAGPWQATNTVHAPDTTSPTNVVYVYVGEGGISRTGNVPGRAAWNGGSRGGYGSSWGAGSGGAGATSVSLTRGPWSDWQVLIDRLMVAGGGGGYSTYAASGGAGGGYIAQGGRMVSHETVALGLNDYNPVTGYGPTFVTNGFWTGAGQKVGSGRGGQSFGIGGTPGPATKSGNGGANEGRGGGGGGYFGGEITWGKEGHYSNAGGGGGSSYVSGYGYCISYGPQSAPNWMVPVGTENPLAVAGNVDTTPYKNHYSGRAFIEPDIFELTDLNADNSGPTDSPIPDPWGGNIGTDGLSSRHGVLIIEYLGAE